MQYKTEKIILRLYSNKEAPPISEASILNYLN